MKRRFFSHLTHFFSTCAQTQSVTQSMSGAQRKASACADAMRERTLSDASRISLDAVACALAMSHTETAKRAVAMPTSSATHAFMTRGFSLYSCAAKRSIPAPAWDDAGLSKAVAPTRNR